MAAIFLRGENSVVHGAEDVDSLVSGTGSDYPTPDHAD
jgi:hypothetical protein